MGLIGDKEQALRRTGPDNWAWYGSFINFMTTAWPRESSLDSAKECAVLQLFCVCVYSLNKALHKVRKSVVEAHYYFLCREE